MSYNVKPIILHLHLPKLVGNTYTDYSDFLKTTSLQYNPNYSCTKCEISYTNAKQSILMQNKVYRLIYLPDCSHVNLPI